MGFDALISLKFAEGKRRGGSTYVVKALTEYLKYRPETYCIETPDGIIKEKAFLIACGNASQYGNNAYIAPHASMQDGKIDVTIIRPFTPFDTALLGLQLFTKQIDHNTNIRSFTTDYLSIVREKPGVMHIDGEPIEMAERVDIHCIHAGLRAIAPLEERKQEEAAQQGQAHIKDDPFYDFLRAGVLALPAGPGLGIDRFCQLHILTPLLRSKCF